MARIELLPVITKVHGKFGEVVFKDSGFGTIIARLPHILDRVMSPAQLAVVAKFRRAIEYSRMALADPVARAAYAAKAKLERKPLVGVMVKDFFHAPSVDTVDLSGYTGLTAEKIHIQASDDFEVVGVRVAISDADGTSIESGAAVKDASGWVYTATASVTGGTPLKIEVTATDRPGNATTKLETK